MMKLCYRWLYCKRQDYSFSLIDLQVNSRFVSYCSSFINEMCQEDYTNDFTIDQIFSIHDDLIKWVQRIAIHLGFVVVTIKSDKTTSQVGRKTFVLLGYESGGKYMKYKLDVQPSIYGTRKSEFPLKLKDKPNSNIDGWILKVILSIS